MARTNRTSPAIRCIAALAVSFLVAGCGTRLSDARIEAAAGVGPSVATGVTAGGVAAGSPGGGEAAASPAPDTGTAAAGPTPSNTPATGLTAVGGPGAAAPDASPAAPARVTGSGTVKGAAGSPAASAAAGTPSAHGGDAAGAVATPGAPAPTPGAGATPAGATKPPIVFGHIGDYSGLIGTLMKGGDVTAQVIARSINDKGGLDGHPVKMIVGDAGGDPARALSLARDMVENRGAVAFVGTLMVFSGNGPRDYLEQKKIPIIGGDGTTLVWNQSPMYFPSAAGFPSITLGALKGLVDLGKKKIALFHCVEAEQCKIWHDTAVANAEHYGAKIVYQAQVSLAQPDFTAECIQAQRNGADGVMTGVDGPSVTRFARACAQQGYRPQYMTASLAVIDSISKDPNLDGLMAPQGVFPYIATDLPAEKTFEATMTRYAPQVQLSPAVAQVWTGGVLLEEVAKKLPDGKVTSADFFPGLYSIRDNTLGGLVGALNFNVGKPADEVHCVYFIKVAGGRWTAPDGSKQACF